MLLGWQGGETLATAMFGGATRSEVRTGGAAPASATLQPFTHLQLDILPPHVNSLADAFEFFIAAEDIEGASLDFSAACLSACATSVFLSRTTCLRHMAWSDRSLHGVDTT